jgi:Zn-finger protein
MNCLWRPCLLLDRDEISNLYRGLSIDASYLVSVHLAKRFQRRFLKNRPIRNKNCLWWPCLLTDWDKMSNLYKRTFHRCFLPSFGSLGHAVSEEIFRNRPIRNKNCLWWPCLLTDWDKMSNLYKRTFHRCFLPSFGSFGHAVSEEKIFRNRPIRNKNRLWWPCLLMDMGQNEQSL